jgi:hypothetical protein
MHVILMQNKYYSFCKQLGRCPSINYAMSSKERGFKTGIGKAGSILAPALIVLNLPVAQARTPGKIAIRQRLQHTRGVCQTQMAGTKTQRSLQVSSSCRIPYRCANRLKNNEIGVLTTLSHNQNWNYWCRDGLSHLRA